MSARFNLSKSVRQRGMGLIELMIGMTIGLIVLMALGYFFLGSQQANRTHNDISRMQESGRNAMEMLGTAIRQAGWYRADNMVVTTAFPAGAPALSGTDGTPDTITLRYYQQDASEADCAGSTANNPMTYVFAVNGLQQLTCNNGTTTNVVVDNIEDMQIEYGIDANKDGVIESYTATPANFGQVAAVRINLTVRGPTANAATGGDGFLRQTYATTFTVRNQAW